MKKLLDDVRADLRANAPEGGAFHPGFWVAATYRVGRAAHRARSRPLRWGLLTAHRVLSAPFRAVLAVHIPHNADIGPGLSLPHPRNIILPPHGRFGRGVRIHHDVTVGRGSVDGVPHVGDRVTLCPGARLLGGVTVGDDAHIGENAVVTRSIPSGATASVPPCRVIPAQTAERLAAVRRDDSQISAPRTARSRAP